MTSVVTHRKYKKKRGPWTEALTKQLISLWADGLSASQIAGELGCGLTRNAIIGKVHRIGLHHRANSHGQTFVDNPKKPKPKRTRRALRRNGGGFVAIDAAPMLTPDIASLEQLEATPAPETFLGIPLSKLQDHHCRYPRTADGVHLFCGQPKITDSSYCLSCHRRCHTYGGYQLNISDAERERRRRHAASLHRQQGAA